MEDNKIKILLNSFYEGTSSNNDERELLNYFRGDSVSDEFADDKYLFLQIYNRGEIQIDVPSDLESKLKSLIDNLDDRENKKIKHKKRQLFIKSISVAASLFILLSIGYYLVDDFDNKPQSALVEQVEEYRFSEDELLALKKAEQGLFVFSSNINKGLDPLLAVSEKMNKTNKVLTFALKTKTHEN